MCLTGSNTQAIRLPRMSIEITTRCNLRCRSCAVGIPTQKETVHLNLSEVRMYLRRIFEVADYVDSMEFTGGEPFLHQELPEMIRAYMEYRDRFRQFLIVTNGTVEPGEELLRALREYKDCGEIHVSDYGIRPEVTDGVIAAIRTAGVRVRVDRYWGDDPYQGGWVEPGEVISHGRSETQRKEVFSRCGLARNGGCWRLHKGRLHFCARSARCFDEGLSFPKEYLDFTDGSSPEERRKKLCSLLRLSSLRACDYCNGDMGTADGTKRILAGVQVKQGNLLGEENGV